MSTRSSYRFIEEWVNKQTGETIRENLFLLYGHSDGYPTGYPMSVAKWLSEKPSFNGAGCLAAQFVRQVKTGIGQFYIHSINDRGHIDEDYTYDIIVKPNDDIELVCYKVNHSKQTSIKQLFTGTPNEFINHFDK